MITEIFRLIDRNEPFTIFLGAGFSLGKWNDVTQTRDGLGTGNELAEYLIEQRESLGKLDPKTLINICDEYSCINESELRGILRDYLGRGTVQNSHKLLVDIIDDTENTKDFLITVNVDDLVEQAYRSKNGSLLNVAKCTEDMYTAGDKVYLKLHGCVTSIDKAVFNTKDYLNVDNDNRLYDRIKTIFTDRTIIFIGFGMQDIDVLKILYRVKPNSGRFTKPHYWVVPKASEWSDPRARFYLQEFNINHIEQTSEEFLSQLLEYKKKKKTVKF
jgi:hypothetical protein